MMWPNNWQMAQAQSYRPTLFTLFTWLAVGVPLLTIEDDVYMQSLES